jgi:hypothetical protein
MVAAADRSAGGWWRAAALCDPVSVPLRLRVYFATTQGDSVFTKHKQPPAGAPHPRVCDGRPAGQSTGWKWTPGPLHTTQYDTPHHCRAHSTSSELNTTATAAHTSHLAHFAHESKPKHQARKRRSNEQCQLEWPSQSRQ